MKDAKVAHKITPYGLSETEWRCSLLHLVNQDRSTNLPTTAMKLVRGLETKLSEGEMILKHVKRPISDLGKSETRLSLVKRIGTGLKTLLTVSL